MFENQSWLDLKCLAKTRCFEAVDFCAVRKSSAESKARWSWINTNVAHYALSHAFDHAQTPRMWCLSPHVWMFTYLVRVDCAECLLILIKRHNLKRWCATYITRSWKRGKTPYSQRMRHEHEDPRLIDDFTILSCFICSPLIGALYVCLAVRKMYISGLRHWNGLQS